MKLKTFTVFLLFLGISTSVYSQNIQGKAYYTSMVKLDKGEEPDPERKNDPQFKALYEQLNKPFIDDFTLEFTEEESIFEIVPKLEEPKPKEGGMSISIKLMDESEILYKNISEELILTETDFYGKKFLVNDTFNQQWEIHKESKTIGDYVCFKATYTPEAKENSKKAPDEIVAWFTPQIPVKNGPFKYQNLPGLIMEIHEGNKVIACTKVVLNPEETIEIIRPKRGEKITSSDFDTLRIERSGEMMKNLQNRKSRRN